MWSIYKKALIKKYKSNKKNMGYLISNNYLFRYQKIVSASYLQRKILNFFENDSTKICWIYFIKTKKKFWPNYVYLDHEPKMCLVTN